MKSSFVVLMLSTLTMGCSVKQAQESISGNSLPYREICQKAAVDPMYFQQFRSNVDYSRIVEIGDGGKAFINYLLAFASKNVLDKMIEFEKLDQIGSPWANIPLGPSKFSATTLRYIAIAVHIEQLFSLPTDAKIAEIGAGFGGQCFVLSQLNSISNYYIFDLPEVEALIEKVITSLKVNNVSCMASKKRMADERIDLVISNYAFSECERQTQLQYFEKVISKAERGYVIYNQIAPNHGIDYLSPEAFVDLLKQNGKYPKIYKEPVMTDANNILIVWGESSENIF
jgi:hypothetical protein